MRQQTTSNASDVFTQEQGVDASAFLALQRLIDELTRKEEQFNLELQRAVDAVDEWAKNEMSLRQLNEILSRQQLELATIHAK